MASIELGTIRVEYHIERKKRRTIAATITKDGELHIMAPHFIPDFLIRRFLEDKKHWIIAKVQQRQAAKESGFNLQYTSGSYLPFFGAKMLLTITDHQDATKPRLFKVNNTFQVFLPTEMSDKAREKAVRELFQDWYLRNTKQELEKRIAAYAQQMGATYNNVTVKDVTSHWGSCSIRRNLNFNYRISMLPLELCDYIIVHELCHLWEMNHSANFWDRVGAVVPNYKFLRKELKSKFINLD